MAKKTTKKIVRKKKSTGKKVDPMTKMKELVLAWRKDKIQLKALTKAEAKSKSAMKKHAEKIDLPEGNHFGLKYELRTKFAQSEENLEIAKENKIKVPKTYSVNWDKLLELAKAKGIKIPQIANTNWDALEEAFAEQGVAGVYSVTPYTFLGD